MTDQQVQLFLLFGVVFGLLVWGRIRHDLVAAMGLFAAVILGLVPDEEAFSGFANPAVAIVALVLVASRAIENSGALRLASRGIANSERKTGPHIALMASIGAGLSTVINNVAALAMLMPIDIQASRKAERSPGLTLMPLSFATILGGMVTLIGTPPNIIAAGIRAERLGESYSMFDFAPVGLCVAIAGVAFVSLFGSRLLARPSDVTGKAPREEEFMAELIVPESSKLVGKTAGEFKEEANDAGIALVGILKDNKRLVKRALVTTIAAGDMLIVEGGTDGIGKYIEALGLQREETAKEKAEEKAKSKVKEDAKNGDSGKKGSLAAFAEDNENVLMEAVVRAGARVERRNAKSFRLHARFGVTVLGISHDGRMLREKLNERILEAGDLVLLSGTKEALSHVADWLGVLPVNEVSVAPVKANWRIAAAIGFLAAAIAVTTIGWLSFEVAIAIAVAGYGAVRLVPAHEFYSQIDWSIVVLLACLLPLGEAFDRVGATEMLADALLGATIDMPIVVSLVILMVGTMALSDVLNNVATIVIAGPLAIATAQSLDVNPDTFLMGVTVAACCAFLTPIGHKNNMLVMGPGGYRFGDYWRLGLPLEILVMVVSVPALLYFWPL
jgi:di/tricarboxylate transporter